MLTDVQLCSVTITEPAALVATCSVVSNVTCNGGNDGSASVVLQVVLLHTLEQEHSRDLQPVLIFTTYLMQVVAQLLVQ